MQKEFSELGRVLSSLLRNTGTIRTYSSRVAVVGIRLKTNQNIKLHRHDLVLSGVL